MNERSVRELLATHAFLVMMKQQEQKLRVSESEGECEQGREK